MSKVCGTILFTVDRIRSLPRHQKCYREAADDCQRALSLDACLSELRAVFRVRY